MSGRWLGHWSVGILLLVFAAGTCAGGAPAAPAARIAAGPVRVEIRKEAGKFRLYRGGEPYFIRGAVYFGDPKGKFPMRDIAARGGNSVRSGGKPILDEAQRLGMTVTVGLPMRMEWADKFDYSDEQAVRRQFEQVKSRVLDIKDHPAVLLWGIGNELSVRYTNKKVWNAVNDVARMIHEVDPNHPAMTVIGDADRDVVQEIMKRCPDLDLLGVNNYQGVETVPAKLREAGWDKPYAITEWGPSGDWQVQRTKWRASIEETSTEKARRYLERYQNTMLKDTERCLGSYAFIWMARHERTPTWYGMFLESGERTEAVNVMQFLWTENWPSNRAPRIEPPRIDGRAARDNVYLKPGSRHTATVQVEDPDGDRWTCRWEIMAEVVRAGYAGRGERRSQPIAELIQEARGGELTFTAPAAAGAYRAFVFIVDGQGNGATANIPFYVSAD